MMSHVFVVWLSGLSCVAIQVLLTALHSIQSYLACIWEFFSRDIVFISKDMAGFEGHWWVILGENSHELLW